MKAMLVAFEDDSTPAILSQSQQHLAEKVCHLVVVDGIAIRTDAIEASVRQVERSGIHVG